jgi:hypothetical protein
VYQFGGVEALVRAIMNAEDNEEITKPAVNLKSLIIYFHQYNNEHYFYFRFVL